MKSVRSVDEYIERHPEWAAALHKLRRILTATELEETVKWGGPCYTLGGKNVVGIGAFAGYVGLWFHQGVFLSLHSAKSSRGAKILSTVVHAPNGGGSKDMQRGRSCGGDLAERGRPRPCGLWSPR